MPHVERKITKKMATAITGLVLLGVAGAYKVENRTPPIPEVGLSDLMKDPQHFSGRVISTIGYEQMHPEPYEVEGSTPPSTKYYIISLRSSPDVRSSSFDIRVVRDAVPGENSKPEAKDSYQQVKVTGVVINSTGSKDSLYYRMEVRKKVVLEENILPLPQKTPNR